MLTLALVANLGLAATGPAQLTIELKPPESQVLVDGKKAGDGSKPIVLKLKPGKHTLRVTLKGDAHEEELVLKAGEKKTWKWEFESPTPSPSPGDESTTPP